MPSAGPSKLIRLLNNNKSPHAENNARHLGKNKKKIPWVDVSDDDRDDRLRKTPLKVMVNGHHNHQDGRHPRRNKKPRHSLASGEEDRGAAGPSSPSTTAALQEQRKQLPIAKGELFTYSSYPLLCLVYTGQAGMR